MASHKVRLILSAHGRGELFIDDMQILGVNHVNIDAGVDQLNRVTVSFVATELEIGGEYDVTTIGHDGVREYKTGVNATKQ